MKHSLYILGLTLGRLNQQHLWLMLVLLSLALFLIGAGAPADFGGH